MDEFEDHGGRWFLWNAKRLNGVWLLRYTLGNELGGSCVKVLKNSLRDRATGLDAQGIVPICADGEGIGGVQSGSHLGSAIAQAVLVQTPEVRESSTVFHGLLDELRGVLKPGDAVDEVLVGLMMSDLWRLLRAQRGEARGLVARLRKSLAEAGEKRRRLAVEVKRRRETEIMDIRAQLKHHEEEQEYLHEPMTEAEEDHFDYLRSRLEELLFAVKDQDAAQAPPPMGEVLFEDLEAQRIVVESLESTPLECLADEPLVLAYVQSRRRSRLKGACAADYVRDLRRNHQGLLRRDVCRVAADRYHAMQRAYSAQQARLEELARLSTPSEGAQRHEGRLRRNLLDMIDRLESRRRRSES